MSPSPNVSHLLPTGSDIIETVKDVTFKPFETMTCAEVTIVDDNTQEFPETFSVAFGTSNIPGVQQGIVTFSTITIIDDDLPTAGKSKCSKYCY